MSMIEKADLDHLMKGVKIIHTDVIFIDLSKNGHMRLFTRALNSIEKTFPDRRILFAYTTDKDELIRQAMSELGKRSAQKNNRDYSAMGKKGGWPKGKKRKQSSLIP